MLEGNANERKSGGGGDCRESRNLHEASVGTTAAVTNRLLGLWQESEGQQSQTRCEHADGCRVMCARRTWDAGATGFGLGAGGARAAADGAGRAAGGGAPAAGGGAHASDNWHVAVGELTVGRVVTCGDGG